VTVVGSKNEADVALPAQAAIGQYVHSLAAACGERESAGQSAVWSLRAAGRRPLPPHVSLDMAGVLDGELLYLCDLANGDYDGPVVLEVDERAAAVGRTGGPPWTPGAAAAVTLIGGAAWVLAAALSWLFTERGHGGVAGALALAVGIALTVAAGLGRVRRLGLTRLTRLLLPGAAVPCLAVAGWYAGHSAAGAHPAAAAALAAAVTGLAVGAVVGALAGLAAVPGIETTALAVLVTVAGAAACLFVGLGANAREIAAVVAVAGYGLIALSPNLAVRFAALWQQLSRDEGDTERTVVWAHGLTLAGTFLGAAITAIALAFAALARNPFDIAITAVLSCALLLRVDTCRLLAEALPVIAAALTGLFFFTMAAPRYWGSGGLAPELGVVAFGVAVLILGVLMMFSSAAMGGPGATRRREPSRAGGPTRSEQVLRIALTLCSIAAIPLMLGTFGVFAHLINVGHHL
jgi:hypothetical protein